jgi:hypothetical protein
MLNVLGNAGGINNANAASLVATGKLIKDMGKTVTTTAGDVYRKVQTLTAVSGTDTTFYIKAAPASGSASEWARVTLQNI